MKFIHAADLHIDSPMRGLVTLKFADFSKDGTELADPVPAAIGRLLTAGLSVEDYQSMFGLDHESLRAGGHLSIF